MATFVPDTSCMIPAVSPWHPHHERAAAAINDRLDRSDTMILAAHTLAEMYAGLTSQPAPYRLAPRTALGLIESAFLRRAPVVALDEGGYVALIRSLAAGGVAGGRTYDAVIVATARAAGASELLTFNDRHFRQFEGDGLTIVVP